MEDTRHDPPDAEKEDPRIICFSKGADEAAFEVSFTRLLSKLQERSRRMFVGERNVLRLNHGQSWQHSARDPEPETSLSVISAEWTIPFQPLADNDLGLIGLTLLPLNEEVEKQFSHSMYGVVGKAAEKAGNVVDARKEGSFGLAMLEMFKKIELGVDRDGKVSMPQMHVGPDLYDRLPDEIAKTPPEVEAEIEQLKAQKIADALKREAERKANFKQADE